MVVLLFLTSCSNPVPMTTTSTAATAATAAAATTTASITTTAPALSLVQLCHNYHHLPPLQKQPSLIVNSCRWWWYSILSTMLREFRLQYRKRAVPISASDSWGSLHPGPIRWMRLYHKVIAAWFRSTRREESGSCSRSLKDLRKFPAPAPKAPDKPEPLAPPRVPESYEKSPSSESLRLCRDIPVRNSLLRLLLHTMVTAPIAAMRTVIMAAVMVL